MTAPSFSSAEPFRILVLNYEYPPVGAGGGEVSKFLAEGYARRGCSVKVLTVHWNDLPRFERVAPNLEIRRIFAFRKSADRCSPPRMAAFMALGLAPAFRLARGWRPHAVHCHFAIPVGPIAWTLHRLLDIPYVLTFHGGDVPGFVPEQTDRYFRLAKPLARAVVRRARHAVAVSRGLQTLAQRHYPYPNVTCIPNGVDVEAFSPDPQRPEATENLPDGRPRPVRIVFAGRFNPQKALHRLIEAVALLRQRGVEDFTVELYGGGPLADSLRRQVQSLHVEDRVQFPGWIDRQRLSGILGRSDVFALPSDIEGMPIACLQAMAAGMAVVGSRTMGIEEVVQQGRNGLLVPVGDVNAFADALHTLLRDRPLLHRMCRESRAIAYQEFRWDVIVDRYLRLLSTP